MLSSYIMAASKDNFYTLNKSKDRKRFFVKFAQKLVSQLLKGNTSKFSISTMNDI